MPVKYDVISPDGFSIHFSDTYPSKKKAIEAFEKWKKDMSYKDFILPTMVEFLWTNYITTLKLLSYE